MQTITWGNYTIQTDYHALPPTSSQPGLSPGYNQWQPSNVSVVGENLQLEIQRNSGVYWQGQEVWAAAEAVFQNQLNYGTYYCTFKVVDDKGNSAWDQFSTTESSPNITTIFGIFLYDASGTGSGNTYKEIDILELGFQNQPNNGTGWIGQQPGGPTLNNAQFALQPWDAAKPNQPDFDMVHRIDIDTSTVNSNNGEVTVKMEWTEGEPVNWSLAYGAYDDTNFPSTGTIDYSSPSGASSYVPSLSDNTRLHINLWPYGGPTTGDNVYCQVTNLIIP